jgi:hypothetical protein
MKQAAIACGVLGAVFLGGVLAIRVMNAVVGGGTEPAPPVERPPVQRVQTRHVEPPPEWAGEGQAAYVAADLGFRIDRDELDRWALPVASLRCGNTQFCTYHVDACYPLTIEAVDPGALRLIAPGGVPVRVVGPWGLLHQGRDGCERAASRAAHYLSIDSRFADHSLGVAQP